MSEFQRWLEKAEDKETLQELLSIADDARAIEDRFYKDLSFGTGGLRGELGAGTNRMNVYTVTKATLGLADYLLERSASSVVIAYDSRNQSDRFARLSAEIMSSKGIQAHLFSELTPTPVLSFAVRHLGADAGIVITASHNPKEYNGYKVYNSLGCQITDEAAEEITKKINACDYFAPITPNEDLILAVSPTLKRAFLSAIRAFSLTPIQKEYAPSVVYSPLNGTGRAYVTEILKEIGVECLHTVKAQELPDGNFTTCPYPNPEEKEALVLALCDAARYKPDLVMATDPDADRIGIAVPDPSGEYVLLNGNETGSILLYYILQKKQAATALSPEGAVIKTIVTTDIIFDMAQDFGVNVKEVLTGFKYIGEELEQTADYLLGLEESYGYLIGTHARDKDAVSAAMMIAEACAYFKEQGKTMYEVLEEIYRTYGYYKTDLLSISMPGKDGMESMQKIIETIRRAPITHILGQPAAFDDFKNGLYNLPKSNVLRFKSRDYRIIIRPSGTEPKMKIYLQARASHPDVSMERLAQMRQLVTSLVGK